MYCRWCNHLLHTIRDSSGQNINLYCSNCSISYDDTQTDDLRSKSKLTTPDNNDNSKNPLATTKFTEPSVDRKPVEPGGTFAGLRARGLKITSYKQEGDIS
jgi:DNA-directed RNA polymerase subunit M/transcription elongation factor TFIIS